MAVIAVMVAIAIPTFSSQLEKSREGTDISNIRAAYATVAAEAMTNPNRSVSTTVSLVQTVAGWATQDVTIAGVAVNDTNITAAKGGSVTVSYTPGADGSGTYKIGNQDVPVAFTLTIDSTSDEGGEDDNGTITLTAAETIPDATVDTTSGTISVTDLGFTIAYKDAENNDAEAPSDLAYTVTSVKYLNSSNEEITGVTTSTEAKITTAKAFSVTIDTTNAASVAKVELKFKATGTGFSDSNELTYTMDKAG